MEGRPVLSRRTALEEQVRTLVRRNKLSQSPEEVLEHMLAHTEPGILIVAGMSAALALLRVQGTTRMFLVRQSGLPLHVQAFFVRYQIHPQLQRTESHNRSLRSSVLQTAHDLIHILVLLRFTSGDFVCYSIAARARDVPRRPFGKKSMNCIKPVITLTALSRIHNGWDSSQDAESRNLAARVDHQDGPRTDAHRHLLEQDLRHHPLVFVIQQMTMEHGHALDDRIGEVEDYIHGTSIRNIHSVEPHRLRELVVVFGVREKVDLVYMKGM